MENDVKVKARAYLRAKGTLQPVAIIAERVRAAFTAFEEVVDSVRAREATVVGIAGEWTVQEVVDHLVETERPSLDELWCLLAGRRPPGSPIPASLQSRAPLLRPWPWLLRELRTVQRDVVATLEAVRPDFHTDATAALVLVVNTLRPNGGVEPLSWIEELDWKAYALVFRLHEIDHLNQVKKILAAARAQ
ncbi:MAG: hypothetical protein DMD82_00140 [Candidatus Rokuibacteriota bacterium]|nr:MAG: hypothetical protein DMD82_00140 [Candidatus Rokubacteria bacterium]